MARVLGISIVLCTPLLLASCAPDTARPERSFRIYEENGVTIAETTGGPKYEGELFQYEPVLTLKEGLDEESTLGRPSIPLMDDNGWFYVSDGADDCIAVFTPDGEFSHRIGRRGEGPGEFRLAMLAGIDGDTLNAYDPQMRRLTRFTTSGTLLDLYTIPPNLTRAYMCYHAPGGRKVFLLRQDNMRGEHSTSSAGALVLSSEYDTLSVVSTPVIQGGKMIEISRGNMIMRSAVPIPFSPVPFSMYDRRHGIILTTGEEPVIELYNLAGDVYKRIKIDLPPQPFTDEDRRLIEAEYDKSVAEATESSRPFAEARRKNITFPSNKVYWTAAIIDDSSYYWLPVTEHTIHIEEAGGGTLYKVLSPEGEYLGETRRPPGPSVATQGYLSLMDSDQETGEYKLIIYSILPAVEGLKYP